MSGTPATPTNPADPIGLAPLLSTAPLFVRPFLVPVLNKVNAWAASMERRIAALEARA